MRSEYSANQALSTTVQRRLVVKNKPSSKNGFVVWALRVCAGSVSAVLCIKVIQCLL
jgi:hypothetical protein